MSAASGPAASRRGLAGHLAVAAAALCWGASAAVAKRSLAADSPIEVERLVAARTAVAALLMSAWVLWRRREAASLPPGLAGRARLAFVGGAFLTGALLAASGYTYYMAVRDAGVAVGILLQYLAPFFIFVYSALLLREKASWTSWCALGIVLAGAALTGGIARADFASARGHGVACGLFSALLFASYTLSSSQVIARAGYWRSAFWVFLSAAAAGAVLSTPADWLVGRAGARDLLVYLWVGAAGTVVPFSLYMAGVERIGPVRAGMLSTLEPVFGALAAYFLVGERLESVQAAGGALVVGAVLALALSRK